MSSDETVAPDQRHHERVDQQDQREQHAQYDQHARAFTIGFGMAMVLLGFLTLAVGRMLESGFVHGMFLGATIALMIGGAYCIGRGMWGAASNPGAPMWRPSRDRDDA